MKAIAYCRVSTLEQAKEGISLDHQITKIKVYAALHDIELLLVKEDKGRSAKGLKNRPGAQAVIEQALSGGVDAVIVYKLDRMFRNAAEALDISAKLNEKGVSLHSVTERLDTQSAMGKFFFTIAAAFAEMERNLIAERTREALEHKRNKGEVYNHAPFGYRVEGGKLKEDGYEQSIIATMRMQREAGRTYREIAEGLNGGCVPTKTIVGTWQPQTVKNILDRAPIGGAATTTG